jgi:hypothetical protein
MTWHLTPEEIDEMYAEQARLLTRAAQQYGLLTAEQELTFAPVAKQPEAPVMQG